MTAPNLDDSETEAYSRPAPGLAAAQPTILRVRLGPLASFLGGGYLENLCTSRVFGTCVADARMADERMGESRRGRAVGATVKVSHSAHNKTARVRCTSVCTVH